jgi:hypothetical protein
MGMSAAVANAEKIGNVGDGRVLLTNCVMRLLA